jgi:hypothetical protein
MYPNLHPRNMILRFRGDWIRWSLLGLSAIRSMMMMMMMTEMVLETSVSYRHLTWLIAGEDFIEFFQEIYFCTSAVEVHAYTCVSTNEDNQESSVILLQRIQSNYIITCSKTMSVSLSIANDICIHGPQPRHKFEALTLKTGDDQSR